MTEEQPPVRRRSRWRRLKRAVVGLVLLYLVAEGVSWVLCRFALSAETRQALAEIRSAQARPLGPHGLIPHPYSLFQLEPGWEDEAGVKQVNGLGWRGRETSGGKPAGWRRVICVGGGTTYGLGVSRPEEAYPARLEAFLRSRMDAPSIEVINCGIPRATSAELFGTVAFRVIHLDPDVIVLQVGLEDVNALLGEDYRVDYTHWRKSWISPRYGRRTKRLLTSPLYRLLFVSCGLPARIDRQFQYGEDPSWDAAWLGEIPRRDPVGFGNNVANTLAITVGRGIGVLLVTERTRRGYPQVEWAVEKHREVLERLGREYEVPVCRFDTAEIAEEGWSDDRHLNAQGNARKAEEIGGEIVRRRLLDRPAAPPTSRSRPAGR